MEACWGDRDAPPRDLATLCPRPARRHTGPESSASRSGTPLRAGGLVLILTLFVPREAPWGVREA